MAAGKAPITMNETSDAGPSRPSMVANFIRMGYPEEMVERAVKENGEEDQNAILDTLLKYAGTSDGGGDDTFDWDTDEEEQKWPPDVGSSTALRNGETRNFNGVRIKDEDEEEEHSYIHWDAAANPNEETSEAGPSHPSVISHFMRMGYPEEMVVRAVKENGEENQNAILDTLLTYAAIEEESPIKQEDDSPGSFANQSDFSDEDFFDFDDYRGRQELREDLSEKDKVVSTLVDMGFFAEEASSAIERCGLDASILELADSIEAARLEAVFDVQLCSSSSNFINDEYKKRRGPEMDRNKKRRTLYRGKKPVTKRDSTSHGEEMSFTMPNPMIGFGLPFERQRISHRNLPEAALGPPYFYYENVALAPTGVWGTISRFLYDIEPEFVDSKFFSAAARKRGYIHNLPITNRRPLQPIPPKTIFDSFPITRTYWPKWDPRTQLNCLQTCIASAQCTERIRKALAGSTYPPPRHVQDYVLGQCRKWNLIWVGRDRVATLEPDEIEMLLGFPRNHTRGGGISRTDRYKSLGNSFQVDTVAYHLSVLKEIFPNGMNVLSLFSGIGGAEVALHRLGIRLKTVVSVELEANNRNIVRSWWEQTHQTGNLIDYADVQELTGDTLKHLISTYGGFDLVIGGSPCNNLAGSNRHTRDGLEGKQSSLFYDYFRILDLVKNIMANNY